MKRDKPIIFWGHSFYGKKRVGEYRKIIATIFERRDYLLKFGIKESFQDDSDFFKEIKKLIKISQYCVFDLAEYSPKKSKINLNVLLEAGVAIGVNRKVYLLSPRKGECGKLVGQITDFAGRLKRYYNKSDIVSLKKELRIIKKNIDENWQAKKIKYEKCHIAKYRSRGRFVYNDARRKKI